MQLVITSYRVSTEPQSGASALQVTILHASKRAVGWDQVQSHLDAHPEQRVRRIIMAGLQVLGTAILSAFGQCLNFIFHLYPME